jgi:hypothetical protein
MGIRWQPHFRCSAEAHHRQHGQASQTGSRFASRVVSVVAIKLGYGSTSHAGAPELGRGGCSNLTGSSLAVAEFRS